MSAIMTSFLFHDPFVFIASLKMCLYLPNKNLSCVWCGFSVDLANMKTTRTIWRALRDRASGELANSVPTWYFYRWFNTDKPPVSVIALNSCTQLWKKILSQQQSALKASYWLCKLKIKLTGFEQSKLCSQFCLL